jgi:hypothetical protein
MLPTAAVQEAASGPLCPKHPCLPKFGSLGAPCFAGFESLFKLSLSVYQWDQLAVLNSQTARALTTKYENDILEKKSIYYATN